MHVISEYYFLMTSDFQVFLLKKLTFATVTNELQML